MARPMAVVKDSDDTAERMTRRLRDAAKEPGLIPCGVWELRASAALKVSDGEDKNGNEQKIVLAQHEPLEAGPGVDPDEVEAIDPTTGMSTYDGKRIFTRFYLPRDGRRWAQFLLAHGYDEDLVVDPKFSIPSIFVDGEWVVNQEFLTEFRGKRTKGDVNIREAREQYPADSMVKRWTQVEG